MAIQRRALIFTTTVTLTDAQIKALPTTPLVILPKAGSNVANYLVSAFLFVDTVAGAYTNVTATGSGYSHSLLLTYSDETGEVTNFAHSVTMLASARQSICKWTPGLPSIVAGTALLDLSGAATLAVNADISLMANNGAGGNYTGGNAANRLRITLDYRRFLVA
jgi:hypothetical protein